jgi:hypothetical protein
MLVLTPGPSRRKGCALTSPSFGIAPPGWYTDPGNPARQRWFDGSRWTDRVQATPAPAPVVPAPPPVVVPPPPPAPPAPAPTPEVVEPAPVPKRRARLWWAVGALGVVGVVVVGVVVTLVVRATSDDGGADEPTGLVDTLSIESGISAGITERTGVATTVQCPERVAAGEVRSFQCVATDADGVTTSVDVQIVDVAGNWTWELR